MVFFWGGFLSTRTPKHIESTLYGVTKHYQKRVISVFLSILDTKMLKTMGNSPYSKPKHYQNRPFWVFLSFLLYKHFNVCKTSFMEKQNKITKKRVFWVFLSRIGNKTPKCIRSTRYRETKRYEQKCIMGFFIFL